MEWLCHLLIESANAHSDSGTTIEWTTGLIKQNILEH